MDNNYSACICYIRTVQLSTTFLLIYYILTSQVCIWDPVTGKQLGQTLIGHKQWITWLTWQPLHL